MIPQAMQPKSNQPLGIVAGWGHFPVELAQTARDQGRDVIVAGIKEHADSQLQALATVYAEFGVAKLGSQIAFFHRHGVAEVLLAGKLFKDRILFHGWGWIGHFAGLDLSISPFEELCHRWRGPTR